MQAGDARRFQMVNYPIYFYFLKKFDEDGLEGDLLKESQDEWKGLACYTEEVSRTRVGDTTCAACRSHLPEKVGELGHGPVNAR